MASTIGIVPDPSEEQTVLAQIAQLLVGDGIFFILIQVATVLVLALAANTAFADFPRLSSFMARDDFMPRQFAFRGERLAFTTGIVALSSLAALLLVGFGASVTALIPLYTLGVFLAFTLSQSSMVVRWWRRRERGLASRPRHQRPWRARRPASSRSSSSRASSWRAPGWSSLPSRSWSC